MGEFSPWGVERYPEDIVVDGQARCISAAPAGIILHKTNRLSRSTGIDHGHRSRSKDAYSHTKVNHMCNMGDNIAGIHETTMQQ